MNILSLFDGMSCGQIALQNLDFKYENYFASEIEPAAIKVTQRNFPGTVQLGDVTKISPQNLPYIDLLIGGSPCFTAGNFVMTINGYKPIEEIVVGDLVLTHNNRFCKVIKVGNEFKKTVKIKAQGSTEIETTEEHPFFCTTKQKNVSTIYSNFYWKKIIDFNKSDKVVSLKLNNNENANNFSDIDLYILGRFLADGCCYKTKRKNRKNSYIYKFKISVGKHEIENFKQKVDNRFSYVEDKTVFNAFIYKKEWVELGEQFGHLAHNKFIPNFILNLPVEKLKIFINGYMDGDGHIRKLPCKNFEYKRNTTVSEKLALTLTLAIQKCFYGVSIDFTKRPTKHIIYDRLVNQKNTYQVSYTEKENPNSKFKVIENYIAYNLSKITKINEIKKVYNIEVELDNSYVVNNLIVHNCQGFSMLGQQRNFDDPRSKLFFEFVRLKDELRPKYFLLENVRMKKAYLDVISHQLDVTPIRINSSLVSAARRDRYYWTNIPNVTVPQDMGITFDDINSNSQNWIPWDRIEKIAAWKAQQKPLQNATLIGAKQKLPCLTARGYNQYHSGMILITNGVDYRYLTNEEAELAHNIPVGYTSICNDKERSHMIGNGWTVNVISHIFENIGYL